MEVMPQLQRIELDLSKAEAELTEFGKFLQINKTFAERLVIAELMKWQHLCCLIGSLQPNVPRADVYKI
jgi:hypothetical protein